MVERHTALQGIQGGEEPKQSCEEMTRGCDGDGIWVFRGSSTLNAGVGPSATAAPGKDAFCRVWIKDPAENVRSLLLCSNDKGIRWGSRAFQG